MFNYGSEPSYAEALDSMLFKKTASPVVVVEVYQDGKFLHRADFRGAEAEANAQAYAGQQGKVILSGWTVLLNGLSNSIIGTHSTFVPDELVNSGRLNFGDVKGVVGGVRKLRVIIVKKPDAPKRSPLHPQALMLDELEFGLKVQRYHGHEAWEIGVIAAKPAPGDEKVQVLTHRYFDGKPCLTEWHLEDMGVIPYGEAGWHDSNYTLAVKD